MTSIPLIKIKIRNIISQNAIVLTPQDSIYYGNVKWKKAPFKWPQFFGTYESALHYVETNNSDKSPSDRDYFELYQYRPNKSIVLLNLTPSEAHSKQIQQLLDLITRLIIVSNQASRIEDLQSVELIALLIYVLFGLTLKYDKDQIDRLVGSLLARKLAYPYTELSPSFVQQLIGVIEDPQYRCVKSRISFRNYDKTLMNALTFLFEKYQIPVQGVSFLTADYPPNACCRVATRLDTEEENWLLCVPSEYIIFRPHLHVSVAQ